MTAFRTLPHRIARERSGSAIIEFALLAPAVIGLMLGVFQIGIAMQSYNAIRSVSADTARYAVVEFQKGETPTNAAIHTKALNIARNAPYLLRHISAQDITVTDATTQRVDGAREITFSISYEAPSILPFFDWASPTVSHSRPIFVLE